MEGIVKAVCKSAEHTMSKSLVDQITLLTGLGVEGDAHCGVTVKHRSRVKRDPNQPNLRQVHLIHSELQEELKTKGFTISEGQMGENITTLGIELLNLPKGTLLNIGQESVVEITGLRNPCDQLNGIQEGLMKALLDYDADNNLVRKAGIMGIVIKGGTIKSNDSIKVILPTKPYIKLDKV